MNYRFIVDKVWEGAYNWVALLLNISYTSLCSTSNTPPGFYKYTRVYGNRSRQTTWRIYERVNSDDLWLTGSWHVKRSITSRKHQPRRQVFRDSVYKTISHPAAYLYYNVPIALWLDIHFEMCDIFQTKTILMYCNVQENQEYPPSKYKISQNSMYKRVDEPDLCIHSERHITYCYWLYIQSMLLSNIYICIYLYILVRTDYH